MISLQKQLLMVCASVSVFALAGCSMALAPEYNPGQEAMRGTEDVQVAAQSSGLDRNTDLQDPIAQHMAARQQVDPKNVNGSKAYTKDAKVAQAEIISHERVAKMERNLSQVKKDFMGFKGSLKTGALVNDITPASGANGKAALDAGHVAAKPILYSVQKVRIGEHADKTRLVMELNGASAFRYEMDNAKGVLVISLPEAQWDARPDMVFENSKILKAYAAKQSQSGGALVAIKLNGPSKVLRSEALGLNDKGVHRIFFDIAPL